MSSVTRLTAAPVTLDCDRKMATNVTALTADLSFGTVELSECLFDRPKGGLGEGWAGGPFGRDPLAGQRPLTCQHIEVRAECGKSLLENFNERESRDHWRYTAVKGWIASDWRPYPSKDWLTFWEGHHLRAG